MKNLFYQKYLYIAFLKRPILIFIKNGYLMWHIEDDFLQSQYGRFFSFYGLKRFIKIIFSEIKKNPLTNLESKYKYAFFLLLGL